SVALPVALLCGSTTIVYVPEAGRSLASTNPPFVPKNPGETRVVPSGFRIETLAELQQDRPIETSSSVRLTSCPATASNVSRAFSPAAVVATVTGEPPGTMG